MTNWKDLIECTDFVYCFGLIFWDCRLSFKVSQKFGCNAQSGAKKSVCSNQSAVRPSVMHISEPEQLSKSQCHVIDAYLSHFGNTWERPLMSPFARAKPQSLIIKLNDMGAKVTRTKSNKWKTILLFPSWKIPFCCGSRRTRDEDTLLAGN